MKYLKTFFAVLLASACLGVGAEFVALVDFNENTGAGTTPGITWNEEVTPDDANSGLNLLDIDGNATGINVAFSGSISNSGSSSTQWEKRDELPPWATSDAVFDRLFVGAGQTATMTLSNLSSGWTYSIEIASSYQSGSGARGSGEYVMTDANGAVEGFNAFTGVSRGTSVMWAANIEGSNGEEGLLAWYNMTADSNGQIVLSINVPSSGDDINPRGALNAMQITAIPEPGTLALIFLGGLLVYFRRRRS